MPVAFVQFFQVSTLLVLPPVTLANLDGTGLKVEWSIERTRSSSPDQGTITIYNLSMATRKAVHELWKASEPLLGYTVQFSIGWEGLAELVFVGNCWRMVPEQRVGEDVLTILEVGDGNKQVRDATVGQSFAKGAINTMITYLVTSVLKMPFDPASKALILDKAAELPIQNWNNYVLNGDPQDRLDELIDTLNLEWKPFQGRFIVTEKGNFATAATAAPLLSAATGLMEWSQEDDGGVYLTALANPNVKPGTQVQVRDSFGMSIGAPAHRVAKVSFHGASDGESVMEIVGRRSVLL